MELRCRGMTSSALNIFLLPPSHFQIVRSSVLTIPLLLSFFLCTQFDETLTLLKPNFFLLHSVSEELNIASGEKKKSYNHANWTHFTFMFMNFRHSILPTTPLYFLSKITVLFWTKTTFIYLLSPQTSSSLLL